MVVLATWLTAASLHTIPTQPMEALSQLDVQSPDHVSVITRDGKVTISVVKDGTSVTLGFPLKNQAFNTTPRPPLQQPVPQVMAVKEAKDSTAEQMDQPVSSRWIKHSPVGNRKLTSSKVRQIRVILNDAQFMNAFNSRQQAYEAIAAKFNVSYHTISNIHKGLAWRNVSI